MLVLAVLCGPSVALAAQDGNSTANSSETALDSKNQSATETTPNDSIPLDEGKNQESEGGFMPLLGGGNNPLLSLLLGAILFLVGGVAGYLIQKYRNESQEIQNALDRTINELGVENNAESPKDKANLLAQKAENDDIQKTPATQPMRNSGLHKAISQLQSKFSERTPGGKVLYSFAQYSHPSDKQDIKKKLRNLNQIYRSYKESVNALSNSCDATIQNNPAGQAEFDEALTCLETMKKELPSRFTGDEPDLSRALERRLDDYQTTVKSYQDYYQQMEESRNQVQLEAAETVKEDVPVRSQAAQSLLNQLVDGKDDSHLQDELSTAVEKLDQYQQVRHTLSAVDDVATLQRHIDELQKDLTDLHSPIAGVLESQIETVEEALNHKSQLQPTDQFGLSKEVMLLSDIVSELRGRSLTESKNVATRRAELEEEIEETRNRYIANPDRGHYDHTIPNKFLQLARDFLDKAHEASVQQKDAEAHTYLNAGEQIVAQVRKLYHEKETSFILDMSTPE